MPNELDFYSKYFSDVELHSRNEKLLFTSVATVAAHYYYFFYIYKKEPFKGVFPKLN